MRTCRLLGHRPRFWAEGNVLHWQCERCGEERQKPYPTAEQAERYARAFDREDRKDLGKRARAAWLVLETSGHSVVQYNGPILVLMRDSRLRFDPYLRRLGPDILAKELDWPAMLVRLRNDDPTRPVADAIMDQRTIAG